MQLTSFIEDLLRTGNVTVAPEIIAFDTQDIQQAETALLQFHASDSLNLPGTAPSFHASAAVWAAIYLYRSIQLTLLRNLDEEAVRGLLTPFPGEMTAAAAYSADLTLRYLPTVMEFAKGLSPKDVLVILMKETALHWPYSSVGMEIQEQPDINDIINDPCLKYSYIDRIIEARDMNRCGNAQVNALVAEALGAHAGTLWPQFKNP